MTRARRGPAGVDAPRVALFGEVGVGNLGNDASFTAVAALLRERVRGIRVEVIGRDVGLEDGARRARRADVRFDGTVPLRSSFGLRLQRSGRGGAMARTAAKLADLLHLVRVVGGYDAVVVPGTGVLERAGRRDPGGVLVWLAVLALACRLRRVPFAWFAVGGGPYDSRLPAWTAGVAARGARYRSFRDAGSRDALPAWAGVGRDAVTHDVVLGRPEALRRGTPSERSERSEPSAGPRTVAVGVIDHDPPGGDSASLRRRYLDRAAALVRTLVGSGSVVELLAADGADHGPVADVREAVSAVPADVPMGRRGVPAASVHTEVTGLDALVVYLADVDVVVSSRYHVLVAAFLARRPVVALSHAHKDDALLHGAGLGAYVVPIDAAEPGRVAALVRAAHADAARVAEELDATCRAAYASVHGEADRLVAALGLVATVGPADPAHDALAGVLQDVTAPSLDDRARESS